MLDNKIMMANFHIARCLVMSFPKLTNALISLKVVTQSVVVEGIYDLLLRLKRCIFFLYFYTHNVSSSLVKTS